MFEETVNRPSRWRIFWPDVGDQPGARQAIELASWFAFAAAILGAIGSIISGVTGGPWAGLVDSAIFGLVGAGIRRGLRSAAVIGFLLAAIGAL